MKKAFISKSGLTKHNLLRLQQVNEVIEKYAQQGYKLSLRQLYYQLVIQNIIPNIDTEYAKLSTLLTKGRMCGVVDWAAIVDRIRQPRHTYSNTDVNDAIIQAEKHYRLDRMEGQSNYIELWVEKDALSDVLSPRTTYYHVRLMVNRGYSSTSAMYDSYKRFMSAILKHKTVNVMYFGDHDPSGLDMDRDIFDRCFLMLTANPYKEFIEYCEALGDTYVKQIKKQYKNDELVYTDGEFDIVKLVIRDRFKVHRIGLTTEQVRQYQPPPNPAKITDPRAGKYIAKHGKISWEVDALEIPVFHKLIEDNIVALIDMDLFNEMIAKENEHKEELKALPANKKQLEEIKQSLSNFDVPLITMVQKGKKKQTDVDALLKNYEKLASYIDYLQEKARWE